MWFMSYTLSRAFPSGTRQVQIGMHVTKVHPLATVRRWQQMYDEQRERSPPAVAYRVTVILTHYTRLSDEEQHELTAAGLDLSAVDAEAEV
jgi:hypothetical protein